MSPTQACLSPWISATRECWLWLPARVLIKIEISAGGGHWCLRGRPAAGEGDMRAGGIGKATQWCHHGDPRSLGRRAEGGNYVGKGYGPGTHYSHSDCYLDGLGENEDTWRVSGPSQGSLRCYPGENNFRTRVLALENHARVNAPHLPSYNKARMFYSQLRQAAWVRTAHYPRIRHHIAWSTLRAWDQGHDKSRGWRWKGQVDKREASVLSAWLTGRLTLMTVDWGMRCLGLAGMKS